MLQSAITYLRALVIGGWAFSCSASLFLTPQEKEMLEPSAPVQLPTPQAIPHKSLVLNAIFHRPDLKQWVVWINDQRIDSQNPRTIEGWIIVHVKSSSVIVRSPSGAEQELFLELTY